MHGGIDTVKVIDQMRCSHAARTYETKRHSVSGPQRCPGGIYSRACLMMLFEAQKKFLQCQQLRPGAGQRLLGSPVIHGNRLIINLDYTSAA